MLVFGVIAAALVTVALLIDDLWISFQGRESVIGKDVQKCVAFAEGRHYPQRESGLTASPEIDDNNRIVAKALLMADFQPGRIIFLNTRLFHGFANKRID